MLLSANGAQFSDLIIQDCQRAAAAVSIGLFDPFSQQDSEENDSFSATFRNIDFLNNGGTDISVNAGALFIAKGNEARVIGCMFDSNIAPAGGAIHAKAASLVVRKSVFLNNTAINTGGALYASADESDRASDSQEVSLEITECQFSQNRALVGEEDATGLTVARGIDLEVNPYFEFPLPTPSGGALSIADLDNVKIEDSSFNENSAVPAGGAIFLGDNLSTEISSCEFANNFVDIGDNTASYANDLLLGGAIFAAMSDPDSDLKIVASSFDNNTAGYGGAIHLVAPISGKFSIRQSRFIQNTATVGGGALLLRNIDSPELISSSFIRNSAFLGGSIFVTNGGGLRITFSSSRQRTIFRNNVASSGGAFFAIGAGTVQLYKVSFHQNNAERNGGAVCMVDSKARGDLTFQEVRMHNNKAERGGAVFLENLNFVVITVGAGETDAAALLERVIVQENHFFANEAVAGGAIYYRASNLIRNQFLADICNFVGNKAHANISSVFKEPLDYPRGNNQANGISKRRLLQIQEIENETMNEKVLVDPLGMEPCYPGGGGAVCLDLNDVAVRAPISVTLLRTQFVNNDAIVAGGLFAATDQSVEWRTSCPQPDESTSALLANDPCRNLNLRISNFTNNFAHYAGGGMYASNLSHVQYSDVNEDSARPRYKPIINSNIDEIFQENSIGAGGYGPHIAGNAIRLSISKPILNPLTGLLIQNQSSGQSEHLKEINIQVLDEMDHVVTGGVIDSNLRIRVRAINPLNGQSIASGQIDSVAEGGVAKFESLALAAHAGDYEIEFLPPRSDITLISGIVRIRSCGLGEINDTVGFVCEYCPPEFFTYETEREACYSCPVNSNCRGGASVVPLPKYWHSTPFSTVMHECFHRGACSYSNRTQKLEMDLEEQRSEFINRLHENENPEFYNSEYKQCADGYKGPLCGSCEDGYGNADGKNCGKCGSKSATAAIVFLLALWQLVLISITIRSALVSIKDMNQMVALIAKHQNSAVGGASASTVNREITERALHSLLQISQVNSGADTQGVSSGQVQEAYTTDQQVAAKSAFSITQPGLQKQKNSIEYIIAAQHVSETIKIFVNFFQVTSVAVNINVDWTTTVKNMLATMNSIAGFSNGASFTPMTCMLDSSADSRSISGVILRIAFPLCLMLIVMFFFVVQWVVMFHSPIHTRDQCSTFLRSRLIICFLVVVFFSYQAISEDLMGSVSCITLDSDKITNETQYPQFATARDKYWTEDTSIECFEGKHAYLAGFLGIPGIIFFIFGVPAALLFLLLQKRSQNRLLEMNVLNTYGFIYQNYETRFVYWEVCILIRKALIGAVIVFAYPLGANLQGVMALGVLILALAIHLIAAPFKYLLLNILEGCSLLVSIFTFYVGVVFNDENTSYTADILLSTLLVLINMSLVIVFLVCVFKHADKYIVAKLQWMDVQDIPANFIPRVTKLARVVAGRATATIVATLHGTLKRSSSTRVRQRTRSLTDIPMDDTEVSMTHNGCNSSHVNESMEDRTPQAPVASEQTEIQIENSGNVQANKSEDSKNM